MLLRTWIKILHINPDSAQHHNKQQSRNKAQRPFFRGDSSSAAGLNASETAVVSRETVQTLLGSATEPATDSWTHMHTCWHIHNHAQTWKQTYMHTNKHTCIHAYTYIYTRLHAQMHIRICQQKSRYNNCCNSACCIWSSFPSKHTWFWKRYRQHVGRQTHT